jgi:hypothetical protein
VKEPEPHKTPREDPKPYEPEIEPPERRHAPEIEEPPSRRMPEVEPPSRRMPEVEPPMREPDRQPGQQTGPEIQTPGIHEAPDPNGQPPGMPAIIA